MTAREEFTRKVKSAAFERAAGRCECCEAKLFVGKYQYDHHVPCALGGRATLSNCRVLCDACHGAKTAHQDVPVIAKSNRQRDKYRDAMKRPPRLSGAAFRKSEPQRTATRPIVRKSDLKEPARS